MTQDSAAGLENCLKFLKGNSDEQRLVGLLLATKYVQGDDKDSILQIFDAMGVQFINRLLKSGVHVSSQGTKEQEEPYIQLAISVLSAFCRIPELAASDEIIDKIPILLEILRRRLKDTIVADCLECILGIASASKKGSLFLQQSGAFPLFLEYLSSSELGSACLHSSVKIMLLLLNANISEGEIVESAASIISTVGKFYCCFLDLVGYIQHYSEIFNMPKESLMMQIQVLAEVLLCEQGSLKLDVLLLLRTICTSEILMLISMRGRSKPGWLNIMRSSIAQILQGQTVVEQKFLALELTKSIIDCFGSSWLLGPMVLPGESKAMPLDRFFLLLVETLRVETIVLLNEVARLQFETACNSDDVVKSQHLLATCYSLLESAISITIEEEDAERLSDVALRRTVSILNEVINTVIEFLEEAKRQSMTKGDDILASTRLFSRYLADAPSHQRDLSRQFLSLLEYLFTITSDSEESPFLVVQFLLPAVCEITREKEGCKAFVSWGGHRQVIAFMLKAVLETDLPLGLLVKAGDVVLNILQKENRMVEYYGHTDFLPLLATLPSWADSTKQCMEISLAACICVLILDLTSEEVILQSTSNEVLSNVYSLLIKVLHYLQKFEISPEPAEEEDLWDLTVTACAGLIDRYPSLRDSIKSHGSTHTTSSSTHLLLKNLLDRCKEAV